MGRYAAEPSDLTKCAKVQLGLHTYGSHLSLCSRASQWINDSDMGHMYRTRVCIYTRLWAYICEACEMRLN